MPEFVPVAAISPRDVLDTINASFDQTPKSLDWYRWKHLSGPWGPSVGWAAVEGSGVLGVRLFVPWLTCFDGTPHPALRAMDGAVRPEGRRRGLFSELVRRGIDDVVNGAPAAHVLYSTSVPASRDAYRKLGWGVFDVPHAVTLPGLSTAALTRHDWPSLPPLPATAGGSQSRLETLWDERSLTWRLDPRSGHRYRCYSLQNADDPAGIVVRRTSLRGTPTLAVLRVWGTERDRRTLVAAAARVERCFVALATASHGRVSRFAARVPSTTVSWWSSEPSASSFLEQRAAWNFDLLDLEGVM